MRPLIAILLCCACSEQRSNSAPPDTLAALRAAILQRTADYPNPWDGTLERVELRQFEDDENLFVALFDSEEEWWGDFVVFCADEGEFRWIATLSDEDEPGAAYGVSARGHRLAGFPDPFVEVFWSSHMGNGAIYLYELQGRRLRKVLDATAVDAHWGDGSVFRGGKLRTVYQDVNGDGHVDVVLVGMLDEMVRDTDEILASHAISREFVWKSETRVFEPASG